MGRLLGEAEWAMSLSPGQGARGTQGGRGGNWCIDNLKEEARIEREFIRNLKRGR